MTEKKSKEVTNERKYTILLLTENICNIYILQVSKCQFIHFILFYLYYFYFRFFLFSLSESKSVGVVMLTVLRVKHVISHVFIN